MWAFYAGSLEQGNATGRGPYIAAEIQGPKFGTTGSKTGTVGRVQGTTGKARVTLELLHQLTAMQRYLQKPGNDAALTSIAKCVRAQFKAPLIQGCLYYAHKSSSEILTEQKDLSKMKAEAWAYCVPILPSLHEADPASAQLLKDAVNISSVERPNWNVVKRALSNTNMNKMGLMCEDIGYLGANNAAMYVNVPPMTAEEKTSCKDDTALIQANPSADSTKCAGVKMPCGNGGVCSASLYLQPSRLLALVAISCVVFFYRASY